jgi:hypothetical protein
MGTLVTDGDVYVAEFCVDYEGSDLLGVFGSLALAKDACNQHRARYKRPSLRWARYPHNWYQARVDSEGISYNICRVTINEYLIA